MFDMKVLEPVAQLPLEMVNTGRKVRIVNRRKPGQQGPATSLNVYVIDVATGKDIDWVQAFSFGFSIDDSVMEALLVIADPEREPCTIHDAVYEYTEIVILESISI